MYVWFIICIHFSSDKPEISHVCSETAYTVHSSCFIPGFIYKPVQWSHFHEVTGLRVIPELKTNILLCGCFTNISGE